MKLFTSGLNVDDGSDEPIHSTLPATYPTVNQKHHHRVSCVKAMKVSESSDMWNANCSPVMSTVFT